MSLIFRTGCVVLAVAMLHAGAAAAQDGPQKGSDHRFLGW